MVLYYDMHLQFFNTETSSSPNVHYKNKLNMLRCSRDGEIRETKTLTSYIAALKAATIYSIQTLSTSLMFRVLQLARSTRCEYE